MKKTLLLISSLLGSQILYAQSQYETDSFTMTQKLVMIGIIYIACCIGAFLLARVIFLWYWKINVRIRNQERTNILLEQILNKLPNSNKNEKE